MTTPQKLIKEAEKIYDSLNIHNSLRQMANDAERATAIIKIARFLAEREDAELKA